MVYETTKHGASELALLMTELTLKSLSASEASEGTEAKTSLTNDFVMIVWLKIVFSDLQQLIMGLQPGDCKV